MSYHFDITHLVQCVGHLLKKSPNQQHNYTAVLKMLYLADRESIKETGSPITGDAPFAMKLGPVLSQTYDLMRGKCEEENQAVWGKYIELRDRSIALVCEPGCGTLSEYEEEILDKVYESHGSKTFRQLVEETHTFPEWIETVQEGTSAPINLRVILKALGQEDRFEELSTQRIEDCHFAKLFGG